MHTQIICIRWIINYTEYTNMYEKEGNIQIDPRIFNASLIIKYS